MVTRRYKDFKLVDGWGGRGSDLCLIAKLDGRNVASISYNKYKNKWTVTDMLRDSYYWTGSINSVFRFLDKLAKVHNGKSPDDNMKKAMRDLDKYAPVSE